MINKIAFSFFLFDIKNFYCHCNGYSFTNLLTKLNPKSEKDAFTCVGVDLKIP